MWIRSFLILASSASASSVLQSDEHVLEVLLRHHRSISIARRLQGMGPPGGGGGGPPGGGGATAPGATTANTCGNSTCTKTGGGSYMNRAALSWSASGSTAGTFSGSFTTNGCPNHAGAYEYNGVVDSLVPTSSASCIQQTIPASSSYATPPAAAPLRGVIGYTISGGEQLYGPMDAGFSAGQVCTNGIGVCPAGTDTRMCGAWLERVCGTKNLKGNTSATMHMLLSDCGGHAGYHNHERLACEYSPTAAGHSAMVAVMLDGRALFGQYEATGAKPTDLDACGGHYGPTPASTVSNSDGTTNTYGATTNAYHYHVQSEAPFFVGCFGPVSGVAAAKALYPSCADSSASTACSCGASSASCSCAAGSSWSVCTSLGSYSSYRLDCPIYSPGLSQRNETDKSCVPCAGSCPGVGAGDSGGGSGGANAISSAALAIDLALAAVALVASAGLVWWYARGGCSHGGSGSKVGVSGAGGGLRLQGFVGALAAQGART